VLEAEPLTDLGGVIDAEPMEGQPIAEPPPA
jgi:hypothetical protein